MMDMEKQMMRILLIGRTGQIGWELERSLAPLGCVAAPDRSRLDLQKPEEIRKWVRETKPHVIINAAAYTAVDKAEEETDSAMKINGHAPGIIGEEAKKAGALVIHYSTDYIFDGGKNAPYTENDAANPINTYGATKLAGELALQSSGAPCIIFRTSWVYGLRGRNFLLTILKLAKQQNRLTVVNDQTGAPTWSRMVAEATAAVLAQKGAALADMQGVYHLSCQGQTTWYGFARKIMEFQPDDQLRAVDLRPIASDEYTSAARRPKYSVLSNTKLASTFGILLPPWQDALKLALHT